MVPKVLFCWVLLFSVLGAAPAPERFVVRLETTKGNIDVECFRSWAPNGADRFYELVTSGYYNDAAIFRIRPKTWVQFGINGDPKVSQATPTFAGRSSLRGRSPMAGRRKS